MTDNLDDTRIAELEAETGLDLSGDEAPSALPPSEAAISLAGEAAPTADSRAIVRADEAAVSSIRELLDERDRRIELERRIREVEARLTPPPPQEQPYQPDPFIDPSAFAPASRGGSARSEARGRIANLATLVVTATDGAMSRVRMQLDIDRLSPGSPSAAGSPEPQTTCRHVLPELHRRSIRGRWRGDRWRQSP